MIEDLVHRTIGCGSIFGRHFLWPHTLCGWFADRRIRRMDMRVAKGERRYR